MSIYKLNTKLALLIIVGLIASPFAEAAFRTSKTGKGKFDGTTVSTITSTCVTNGFPTDAAGASLCQEVTDGTYDADCVNWGLDQSPIVSISACSGLTHTQYTSFKTALGQATLDISNGGNGFASYTEQKSYFDTYLTNTKAIYANQLGYSAYADHNTTYEGAASAVASLQTQCSSSTTSPLTTCSASISNCACIPKSEYDNIASGTVAVAAALNAADNTPHTLTKALIDNIVGLDTSSIDLTDSNVIDYLAAQFAPLDTSSTTQPSQLTSYVIGATATNVALWKIGKMVSDSTNHPSSGLTEGLVDNAIGNSFSTSDVLALDSTKTIGTLRTALASSGLGSSPTASAVQDWVGTHIGFASAASFTAYLANTDNSNFSLANWTACYTSTETSTGGSNSCNVSLNSWQSISAVASVSSPDDLTDSNLQNAIAAASITDSNSVFGDLTNLTNFEADYIRDCMGTTTTVSQIDSCVSSGTTAKLTTQKVSGMIAGDYTGTPTVTDFENAGIGAVDTATGNQNVITFLKLNVCGTNGTTSCGTALGSSYVDSSLVSASGSGSSTQTALLSYLQDALLEYNKSVIDNTPSPPAQTGTSCGTISLNVPAVCAVNPLYSCTAQSGWTMSANQQTMSKSWGSSSGTVSATVTINRNTWWGGAPYSRTITTSTTLADGGTIQYTFTYEGGNHSGFASALDACFDAGGVMVAANNISSVSGWPSNTSYVMPSGSINRDRAWWNSRSEGDIVGPTCGRYGSSPASCGSTDACAGPAAYSNDQSSYNINRYIAFSCTNTSNDHKGSFVCRKSACS
ncbi:MAG: hypothetical protein GWP33_08365 [Alphaproteobacteria bacterium]|nr:hypothetical protein [Alphaproteobacteria bacterium]